MKDQYTGKLIYNTQFPDTILMVLAATCDDEAHWPEWQNYYTICIRHGDSQSFIGTILIDPVGLWMTRDLWRVIE